MLEWLACPRVGLVIKSGLQVFVAVKEPKNLKIVQTVVQVQGWREKIYRFLYFLTGKEGLKGKSRTLLGQYKSTTLCSRMDGKFHKMSYSEPAGGTLLFVTDQ